MRRRVTMACLREARRAFSLIELLVVIAIIGLLMALLLPAVQAVRESARRAQCANNVAQMAKAALAHETTQGFYPSGGWGFWWVGDADRGFGKTQPGGYLYSLLPYLEQTAVWGLPVDGNPNSITTAQKDGARTLVRTILPTVNCPTRRSPQLFPKPVDGTFIAYNASNNPSTADNVAARADYGMNAGGTVPKCKLDGSLGNCTDVRGPQSGASIDLVNPWSNPIDWAFLNPESTSTEFNGLVWTCSEVRVMDVADGCSLTYLIGERLIDANNYTTGLWGADNESWVQGTNNDMLRYANWAPSMDTAGFDTESLKFSFGSAHAISFCMSFADGAVKWIRYDIDPAIHKGLANRKDGAIIPGNAIR